ncbi:Peptidase M8, partial [Trypanosoma melophagium]|uniref:Peptidase M8 n=1 Tax=Trypanosoma melophagium TaxID=715481 RepID=UPI00351A7921
MNPAVYTEIMQGKMREHYDFEYVYIIGMYLEDEGDGHDRSYWERRIAKDELMSPYT